MRIGLQTAWSAASPLEPFYYAIENGFRAFEFFPDKKPDGSGWDLAGISASQREDIQLLARRHNISLSVHAPWDASVLDAGSMEVFAESFNFAADIGATLVNIHVQTDSTPHAFVDAMKPVLALAADYDMALSIENTVHSCPEFMNAVFADLNLLALRMNVRTGLCLDIGHANLCSATLNDYLLFMDSLAPHVSLLHVHMHENHGDRDAHLTVFSGPSSLHPEGIHGVIRRLCLSGYEGAIILEQWPEPRDLLLQARNRLCAIIQQCPSDTVTTMKIGNPQAPDDTFISRLIHADAEAQSWLQKLEAVRNLVVSDSFRATQRELTTLWMYLKALHHGIIPMDEHSQHKRPNHHAALAQEITHHLLAITPQRNRILLRRVLPFLPSFNAPFRQSEPLTRIRDIAHRNDIPKDLKQEIKHTLQNKLHRSAGPEDLRTSERILKLITTEGAGYAEGFVQEFQRFHLELQEFFNARPLQDQLQQTAAGSRSKSLLLPLIDSFIEAKDRNDDRAALVLLTELRETFCTLAQEEEDNQQVAFLLADRALEEYLFVLLSFRVNHIEQTTSSLSGTNTDCTELMEALCLAARNARLCAEESPERIAIMNELCALTRVLDESEAQADAMVAYRLKAAVERLHRSVTQETESMLKHTPEVLAHLAPVLNLSPQRAELQSEWEARRETGFQIARLSETALRIIKDSLGLAGYEIISAAGCSGIVRDMDNPESYRATEPAILISKGLGGDEHIPEHVVGIISLSPLPWLSHLAIRARQQGVLLVCTDDNAFIDRLRAAGRNSIKQSARRISLTVRGDTIDLSEDTGNVSDKRESSVPSSPAVCPVHPVSDTAYDIPLLSIVQATAETCGAKAAALGKLERMSKAGAFLVPPAMVVPFSAMTQALTETPDALMKYDDILSALLSELHDMESTVMESTKSTVDRSSTLIQSIRALVSSLTLPEETRHAIHRAFSPDDRLMIRSSANLEDIEGFSAAGLHDSIANVSVTGAAAAVVRVWASLWNSRSVRARRSAGIEQRHALMAVIIQRIIRPEYSFIIHTVHPSGDTGHPSGASGRMLIELAPGLGETLTTLTQSGSPWRFSIDRATHEITAHSFANYSHALIPETDAEEDEDNPGGIIHATVDYHNLPLTADPAYRTDILRKVLRIALFIEEQYGGRPQDIEGMISAGDVYIVQSRPQVILPPGNNQA